MLVYPRFGCIQGLAYSCFTVLPGLYGRIFNIEQQNNETVRIHIDIITC